jgi:hypothetical protein
LGRTFIPSESSIQPDNNSPLLGATGGNDPITSTTQPSDSNVEKLPSSSLNSPSPAQPPYGAPKEGSLPPRTQGPQKESTIQSTDPTKNIESLDFDSNDQLALHIAGVISGAGVSFLPFDDDVMNAIDNYVENLTKDYPDLHDAFPSGSDVGIKGGNVFQLFLLAEGAAAHALEKAGEKAVQKTVKESSSSAGQNIQNIKEIFD